MAFIHISGPAHTEGFAKLASTAIAVGSIVALRGNGYLSQAVVASTRVVGVNLKPVASTDGDFASNTVIPVLIAGPEDIFLADVASGQTAVQADVGKRYDLNTVAAGTAHSVDRTASTYGVVTVVGFVSSSRLYVKINGTYENVEGGTQT